MNLPQALARLPNCLEKSGAPVNKNGHEPNTFAGILDDQRSEDPAGTGKAQTKPGHGFSQQDRTQVDPGQYSANSSLTLAWQIVPVANEPEASREPVAAQSTSVASQPIPDATSTPTGLHVPLFCIPPGRTSEVTANSSASEYVPIVRTPGKLSIATLPVQSDSAASIAPFLQTLTTVHAPQTNSSAPAVMEPPSPANTSAASQTANSKSTDEKSDRESEVRPAVVTAPSLASDPEIAAQDLQSSNASAARHSGVQQFDAVLEERSQAAPEMHDAGPESDEIPAAQIAAEGPIQRGEQSPQSEQNMAAPISRGGIELTEVWVEPETTPASQSQVAVNSSAQHKQAPVVHSPTLPMTIEHGTAPTLIRSAQDESASHSQPHQDNSDARQLPSPAIRVLSPVHSISPLGPDPNSAEPRVAPAKTVSINGLKPSSERRPSSSSQNVPSTDSSGVSPKPAQVMNAVAAPAAGLESFEAQGRTVAQPSAEAAAVGITMPASQGPPSANSSAGADRAALSSLPEQALQREPVNTGVIGARVIEGAGQSDMRIGLRTQAFGIVNVHTALRDAQVGLAVSSERGDLHYLFTSEMPALQSALRQHDLHLGAIKFVQQGALNSALSGETGSGSDWFRARQPSFAGLPHSEAKEEDSALQDISPEIPAKLSVHA